MKLTYAIAALGVAIGLLSLLRAPDRTVEWFIDNDAAREEDLSRRADRSLRGRECVNARLAAVPRGIRSASR